MLIGSNSWLIRKWLKLDFEIFTHRRIFEKQCLRKSHDRCHEVLKSFLKVLNRRPGRPLESWPLWLSAWLRILTFLNYICSKFLRRKRIRLAYLRGQVKKRKWSCRDKNFFNKLSWAKLRVDDPYSLFTSLF